MTVRAPALRAALAAHYERSGWLLVCALPAIVALGVRGPMPIDETRYLSVAWEMWSNHDFAIPTLNGEPYTHKPPLLFWLIHAGWAVFGVNAWWPRCIPLLAAIASVWLLRRLASSLYPQSGGRETEIAVWLLAGTLAWTAFPTMLLFDLLLVVCVLGALVGLERADSRPMSGWCAYLLALGAGLLTKGPAMLVFALPPALAAPWWSVSAARRPWQWYGRLSLALLAALTIGGSWVAWAFGEAGVAFVETILWTQTATRVTRSFAHPQPWWFYLYAFPLLLFPWLFWRSAWSGWRRSGSPRADRLVVAALVPAFILFSVISGKQAQYLLPLVPTVALWLAPRVASASLVAGSLLPAFFLIVLGALVVATAPWLEPAAVRAATGAAIAAGGLLFLRPGAERLAVVRRMALATAITVAMVAAAFFSSSGEAYRLERSARFVCELDERGEPLAWFGPYDGQLNFLARLRHPLAHFERNERQALDAWADVHPEGWIVAYSRSRDESEIPPGLHRQRYRSGWLAVMPAREAHLAVRMGGSAEADKDPVGD